MSETAWLSAHNSPVPTPSNLHRHRVGTEVTPIPRTMTCTIMRDKMGSPDSRLLDGVHRPAHGQLSSKPCPSAAAPQVLIRGVPSAKGPGLSSASLACIGAFRSRAHGDIISSIQRLNADTCEGRVDLRGLRYPLTAVVLREQRTKVFVLPNRDSVGLVTSVFCSILPQYWSVASFRQKSASKGDNGESDSLRR